jgi:hypothetical protein
MSRADRWSFSPSPPTSTTAPHGALPLAWPRSCPGPAHR